MSSEDTSSSTYPETVIDIDIQNFIDKNLERQAIKEQEELEKCLSPKCMIEYDKIVNEEIDQKELYRFLGLLALMLLVTPVIIYAMIDFTNEDDTSSEEYSGTNLILNILSLVIAFTLVGVIAGVIAVKTGINIGYTRKMLHFSSFFLPFAVNEVFPVASHFSITLLKFWLILWVYMLATKPVRRRFYLSLLLFRAIDRPDDRPYTLKWMVSQFLVSSSVILPFVALWDSEYSDELILILVLINGLGDGLAEPVGIKFGKYHLHCCEQKYKLTYRTRAVWYDGHFCNGSFKRSYPGSFMVYIVSLISIIVLNEPFTKVQFILSLVFLPIIMTFTEALSPRTWDSPFLFLVGALFLTGVLEIN